MLIISDNSRLRIGQVVIRDKLNRYQETMPI